MILGGKPPARKVACGECGRLFNEGEDVYAADWIVCDAPDWRWRTETRYTCESCHEARVATS